MNRLLLCLLLCVGYVAMRFVGFNTDKPVVVNANDSVAQVARSMSADDRKSLSQAYLILSRSIAANPQEDPVFPDTESVRRAHRAALLVVWKGVLGNEAGKYPGLREALEGELEKQLGNGDVPLNPDLQRSVAAAFASFSASLR